MTKFLYHQKSRVTTVILCDHSWDISRAAPHQDQARRSEHDCLTLWRTQFNMKEVLPLRTLLILRYTHLWILEGRLKPYWRPLMFDARRRPKKWSKPAWWRTSIDLKAYGIIRARLSPLCCGWTHMLLSLFHSTVLYSTISPRKFFWLAWYPRESGSRPDPLWSLISAFSQE